MPEPQSLPQGWQRYHKTLFLLSALFLFCFALHMNLTAALATKVNHPIRADALHYHTYAYNLHKYNIYSGANKRRGEAVVPDAYRPPGFPMFASLFFGTDFPVTNTLIAQSLILTLTLTLSYILVAVMIGRVPAFIATLLAITSPHLVVSNSYYLTESLFASLLLLSFVLFSYGLKVNKTFYLLVAGVAFGYASLVRPSVDFFMPAYVLMLYLFLPKGSKRITLYFALSLFAIPLVWKLRNIMHFGPGGDSQIIINSFLHGTYPNFMYNGDPATYGYPYRFDPLIPEASQSLGHAVNYLWDKVALNPSEYLLWYFWGKPTTLWQWQLIQGADIFTYPADYSPYFDKRLFSYTFLLHKYSHFVAVAIGMAYSIWILLRILQKRLDLRQFEPIIVVCVALLIYITFMHIFVASFPRYTIPLRPQLFIVVLFCLFSLSRRYKARRS